MSGFPLSEFLVLLGAGLFGAAAILPYAFNLNRNRLSQAKLPLPVLVLLSFLQSALLTAVAVGVGLLAAQAVGLGAPQIQDALAGKPVLDSILGFLPLSVSLGLLSFAVVALLELFVFLPRLPEALRSLDVKTSFWKRLLASFYGGINEEILMRLFLVSVLVWILGRFWWNAGGLREDGAYWTAILLAALLFGLGHLPATRALTPLTPRLVLRALLLNGVAGIAFGWLYWQYGLLAAMLAHFCADIGLHLVGPPLISRRENRVPQGQALDEPR
ncbi:MAG: type II CAAX prenyl endopeptidase Rce1 family protein [Omnitrophica WOR_2 bacterium]